MNFTLPKLDGVAEWSGDSPDDAEVTTLLVATGDTVVQGQDVIELTFDKVNVVLPAPTSGTITWDVRAGDLVSAGSQLAVIS
jgi:pyruvate/2-oxoglutarate dehydrogenase complex dihydrolipoamide acyltransferase (E2) component